MISVFFISKFGHGPEVWEAGEGREGVSVMMDAMKFYMRVMIFTPEGTSFTSLEESVWHDPHVELGGLPV